MRSTVFVVAILSAAFVLDASPAHAYIDPGTASILLQGLVGGAATFIVVLRLYGRKLKRKVLSIFGSDSRATDIDERGQNASSAE